MCIQTLEQFALHYWVSVEELRSVAAIHCGLGNEEQWLVDQWLLDCLSTAAPLMRRDFNLHNTDGVLGALEIALNCTGPKFLESCAESFARLKKKPNERRKIFLMTEPAFEPVVSKGAFHETFSDFMGLTVDTAIWCTTDNADTSSPPEPEQIRAHQNTLGAPAKID
ncbi:MAG: hypothetical protein JST44_23705 [Cyanobacteria bacterium SZAS LIN-5]|nr:hypothetical protein [Cyanobacteria bacterium SZAS LIN-5]